MNKEEFIKLLEALNFEELRCATISYYKKKPQRTYRYDDDTEDYNPKTICIGTDLEKLINEEHSYTCHLFEETMRRINDLKKVEEE